MTFQSPSPYNERQKGFDDMIFERPSLTDIVYEQLKQDICIGELAPGQKLIIDDMIKRYNVSNTPIKEALNRLVSEKLVDAVPRRGMFVHDFTFKEITDFHEAREMIELFCVQKAVKAVKKDPDILLKFEQNLIESGHKVGSFYDYLGHVSLDGDFHKLFVALSSNAVLIDQYNRLNVILFCYRHYVTKRMPLSQRGKTQKEHEAIYSGLLAGDEKALLKALSTHLNTASQSLQVLQEATRTESLGDFVQNFDAGAVSPSLLKEGVSI